MERIFRNVNMDFLKIINGYICIEFVIEILSIKKLSIVIFIKVHLHLNKTIIFVDLKTDLHYIIKIMASHACQNL